MNDSGGRGPILIVGASARAAAFSALAAGYEPHCLDLFADVDLARRCPATAVAVFPHGLLAAARSFPVMPWLFTGGLENYPDLIDEIAQERPLLGNLGDVLRLARDPWKVAQAIDADGCRWPECRRSGVDLPRDGSWLRKGFRSAGGMAVKTWDESLAKFGDETGHFYQKRSPGKSCAAAFLGNGTTAVMLGVTRQLVGCEWAAAPEYHYCGSIGPIDVGAVAKRRLHEAGMRCSARLGLRGLFGLDFLLDGSRVFPVDLNPRFPASTEVLERASEFSAVLLHVDACGGKLAAETPFFGPSTQIHGKVVVFARRKTTVNSSLTSTLMSLADSLPRPLAADIPAPGTCVRPGQPICTLFAQGGSERETLAKLQAAVRRRLGD